MAEPWSAERRRRAERAARTLFVLSNLIVVLGVILAAVGLLVLLVTGNSVLLWIGGVVFVLGLVGSFVGMASGMGAAKIDVDAAVKQWEAQQARASGTDPRGSP